MPQPTRRQRGYTFTEILVVIAIIGILVALLLPAVQAAREAARRMQCSKHLEQLIIAVQNYEMLHQVYPPGTINATGPIQTLPQGYHHNWIVQVLPYLEQKNTYAHIDQLVGVYHPNNMPVRRLDLQVLNCPSTWQAGYGYSDYAGVHNDVEAPIDVTNNGTFFLNSRVSYFDLKDGSSHTLFIGEKFTIVGDLGWMSGTRATLRNTGIPINAAPGRNWRTRRYWPTPSGYPPGLQSDDGNTESLPSDADTLDSLFGEPSERSRNLHRWPYVDESVPIYEEEAWDEDGTEMYGEAIGMGGGGEYGAAGSTYDSDAYAKEQEELKAKELAISLFTDNPALAVGGFGSVHPGGSQFALGDGSVRFISETIDVNVYLQLGHRADGQLTDEDW